MIHDVVANVIDCEIIVSEFELHSHFYAPVMGWIAPPLFHNDGFGIK